MSGLKRLAVYCVMLLVTGLFGLTVISLHAQTLDENALKGMQWRQIGPFRGGRALAVTGVAGDPETYYFGDVAGGVWETENGWRTGTPMSCKTGIMVIWAIAVAPSEAYVVYVVSVESCTYGYL